MEGNSKFLFVGICALAFILFFTPFEGIFEGVLAFVLVATVVLGFSIQPNKEVYYVQTTRRLFEPSGHEALERDFLAVRVELVRLWVLFVPTFLAVAYLTASSANGVLWKFSLLGWSFDSPYGSWLIYIGREMVLLNFLFLQAWVSERRVLRRAEASYATSFVSGNMNVTYAFYDVHGVVQGGDCLCFDLTRSRKLAKIVFYNPEKPDLNKIAMAFLFHRVVILSRGVTDLNMQTVEAQEALAEMRPRRLAPDEV
jgi:hypothetical protein